MKIGVIGAGLMGHGIAYLLAAAGHTVGIYDPSAEWRAFAAARLKSARDLLDGDPALLDRISAHDQMKPAMADASFVFEAAPEKLPLKQQIVRRARSRHRAHHDPRQQQLGDPLDRDRRQAQASRARHRHAFLEPAASRAAGRGDPEREDQRRDRAAAPWSCCATPAAGRCTSRRTFRASSATGCSMRSSARRSRWSRPASATPTPSTRW